MMFTSVLSELEQSPHKYSLKLPELWNKSNDSFTKADLKALNQTVPACSTLQVLVHSQAPAADSAMCQASCLNGLLLQFSFNTKPEIDREALISRNHCVVRLSLVRPLISQHDDIHERLLAVDWPVTKKRSHLASSKIKYLFCTAPDSHRCARTCFSLLAREKRSASHYHQQSKESLIWVWVKNGVRVCVRERDYVSLCVIPVKDLWSVQGYVPFQMSAGIGSDNPVTLPEDEAGRDDGWIGW